MSDGLHGDGESGWRAVTRQLSPAAWRNRRRVVRYTLALALALALTAIGGLIFVPMASADTCANAIVCENNQTGNPRDEWDIAGSGDAGIQGFATQMSVTAGQQVQFKIKTAATSYSIDIYRLGWYNGDGARKWGSVTPSASLPQTQPDCIESTDTQVYDCGNWAVSASWTVPANAVSGVYIARLQRPGAEDGSHIVFVVRNDASTSKMVFQTSDATWQAYNIYGGSDFYEGGAHGRAYELSYNRPFATRGNMWGRDFLFSNEYPTIRFLEQNGYDVSYISSIDSDVRGNLLTNHKIFLSVGHDEYWSAAQRANVEAARDAGVNLAFLSGNEIYWHTRYSPSKDGSATPYRTLVTYKETWANAKIDPSTEWTGTWRDPRFSPPATGGGAPENSLTGAQYMANDDDLPLTVPAEQGNFRLWRNTSAAGKSSGSTVLTDHIIGYESDEAVDNGFQPAGLARLSKTTGDTPQYLRDFGNTVSAGTTTHSVTLYKAASGALVFSAGTIQWGWGLDEVHDSQSAPLPADPAIQQATVNLFADMGVQPTTLMSGLTATGASTDVQAPTATITSPTVGTSVANGASVAVSGTATDVGGGKVAGVDVSTDGGTTWHPATGTTSWSYTFTAAGYGSQTLIARATDDSANLGVNSAGRVLTLTGSNTLFAGKVPANPEESDAGAWELGVKVKPSVDGFITGVRFYKGASNTGTHTGSLWTSSGTRLATGTFSSETSTGWQKLTFSTAVPVTAGTTYVASYYAPNGHYAADFFPFSYRDWTSGPIAATRSTTTSRNGVFRAGSTGFPTNSYNDANYYVDVVFNAAESAPPAVASVTPADGSSAVPVTATPTATFTKAVSSSSVQFTVKSAAGATIAGTTSYDSSTKTAKFTPSASLADITTYNVTVTANDSSGTPMDAPAQWSFTTDLDPSIVKLFADSAVPTVPANSDDNSVELGVKFKPSVSGTIVGIRYYQGAGNTGTHIGTLWSSGGTQLAQLTFPSSTTVGWQTAMFSSAVAVTADTTYVVSYHAPNGHYATNANFFATTFTNGDLSATSVSNGLYRYSSGASFPNNSYQSTNYWVDPLFVPGSDPAPTPTTVGFFGDDDLPASESWPDTNAVELGVKFSSDVAGQVQGVRFYKGSANTGTHTGTLYSASGSVLATGTFSGESASGWQTLTFAAPVTITASTTYVLTYYTPVGQYAVTGGGLSSGWTSSPLHIPAGGAVYRYGGGFPSDTSSGNYWVDVVFAPSN